METVEFTKQEVDVLVARLYIVLQEGMIDGTTRVIITNIINKLTLNK